MDKIINSKYLTRKFLIKTLLYTGLLCVFIFSVTYVFFLKSPSTFVVNSTKNIKPGENLRTLSRELKDEGFIKSRIAFETFVIMYGGERHIQSGDYLFKYKLPVYELARRISFGVHGLEVLKLTIPEGWDRQEIGDYLTQKLPNFNSENFLTLTALKEGFLFPDTYFFFPTATESEIVKAMEENYEDKIEKLRPKILASGKTERDIIIMASLIEREAKGDNDREFISGILWKRLSIGMGLQVDAAPITYKERGLPPRPIANPGLEAINAAIFPKASPYLYYLHGDDGQIHYAKNFAEHKANTLKYLK